MTVWFPIFPLLVTVALLIRAEQREPRAERHVKLWKPLSTALVMLVCLLSLTRPDGAYDSVYTFLILGGLLFSMAGDVFLIYQANPRAFLAGLVAFLIAHLVYIGAFLYLQISLELGFNLWGEVIAATGLLIVGWVVYRYLRPGLGRMQGPVILYMVVISVMVQRALGLAWTYQGAVTQPALVVAGALFFYISDAILAINKFLFEGQLPYGRLWNLSAYYGGQLLLALSTSFLVS
jgi:uncharacterized membrane protein YhhN